MFVDRRDAGNQLAAALAAKGETWDLALAVPRGGVVVGAPVARSLGCPLDILIPKKIGAPRNREVAVGAVAQDGDAIYNAELLDMLGLTTHDLEGKVEECRREIRRRLETYRGDRPPLDVAGKRVVLVDDGIATGQTLLAVVGWLKKQGAASITLAVPVAPPKVTALFRTAVDEVVCLLEPEDFCAVGQYYVDFGENSDEEVMGILRDSWGE